MNRRRRSNDRRPDASLSGSATSMSTKGGETVVKDVVLDLETVAREVLPSSHPLGEARVDFGEVMIWLAAEVTKVVVFADDAA